MYAEENGKMGNLRQIENREREAQERVRVGKLREREESFIIGKAISREDIMQIIQRENV